MTQEKWFCARPFENGNGFVTIKLTDRSTIVVQSKSLMHFDLSRNIADAGMPMTRANLTSGRIEAKVKKRIGGRCCC
jgi:hypothetical protein